MSFGEIIIVGLVALFIMLLGTELIYQYALRISRDRTLASWVAVCCFISMASATIIATFI